MVNLLAVRVLGAGHTGFGPGSDGGRDGYFEGEAPYPSEVDRWSGKWYIQSKFLKPSLSKDPQKWLVERIKEEINEFNKSDSKREWPNNWIIATNIEPSGVPETGAFDRAKKLVTQARPKLKGHFHIWGGRKILDFLSQYPEVVEYYSHFLTPGHVLATIYSQVKDRQAELKTILNYLIVKQFDEQQHTKLEQAGSAVDARPGIHKLFIDLPFAAQSYGLKGQAVEYLVRTAAKSHRVDPHQPDDKLWQYWYQHPARARVWFIKGGPGQGKSTIGQYFCQIQRAALILQDGLTVKPALRSLAREVREAAQKAGFWPSAPRIPITIELKEYAQWFGQRAPNTARGILTFLGEKISAKVEQEVLVGTLKRALQARSWLVVFDGLDEVPQDVKDEVATEVRNFVDDVVIENNCDLLTLCTSRPQGYSGQFSDMDGPTVDLVHLSPEQALQCANPVLRISRSEEDANRYYNILKGAIETGSVRELMTTPLQAHIMAVVVRDGSKPPERRWQLFTNFYQVIRRREANRDLPDKRLAKLLREDEQLLKTVHNRLGFLLHARAETSKGAQTKLNRTEFEALVRDAVKLMLETDIESTVKVLMRATTDRLVLVSTPDDGNHVRFDIRQLQEFFAAEFIYESVSADVLRLRLETIAHDSHWREVIHFLLSALIENNRQTELSVAVGVLEQLNEGEDASHLRLLKRRLGRGALLTARLLEEGVLEQDKRNRQQFRKCLDPLTAFTDMRALYTLTNVEQQNSKSWLLNFLLDSLKEANQTENIGAAIILPHILPNEHKRVGEARKSFLSAPPQYISFILNGKEYDFVHAFKEYPVQTWFLDVLLNLLFSEQWFLLGSDSVRAALGILRANRQVVNRIAKGQGLSDAQIKLLSDVLRPDYDPSNKLLEEPNNKYGILITKGFRHDWTKGTKDASWSDEDMTEISVSSGILQFAYKIVRYSKTQQYSDLVGILKSPEIYLIDSFPLSLRVYLPLVQGLPLETQIAELSSLKEDEYQKLLSDKQVNSRKVGKPCQPYSLGNTVTLEQWSNLLNDLPEWGVRIWGDSFWTRSPRQANRPDILDSEEFMSVLIAKLLEYPHLLVDNPFIWGKLINLNPNLEPNIRKELVVECSKSPSVELAEIQEDAPGFLLDLPAEAPLLPHLANVLIPTFEPIIHDGKRKEAIRLLGRQIREHTGEISRLKHLTDSPSHDKAVRAAAILMLIFHPDSDTDLSGAEDKIVEFYDASNQAWYLRAITDTVGLIASEQDPTARSLIGRILEVARENYKGRKEIGRLLRYWRESSSAPIHTANVATTWLAGSDNNQPIRL
jgi:hypothetical protein